MGYQSGHGINGVVKHAQKPPKEFGGFSHIDRMKKSFKKYVDNCVLKCYHTKAVWQGSTKKYITHIERAFGELKSLEKKFTKIRKKFLTKRCVLYIIDFASRNERRGYLQGNLMIYSEPWKLNSIRAQMLFELNLRFFTNQTNLVSKRMQMYSSFKELNQNF